MKSMNFVNDHLLFTFSPKNFIIGGVVEVLLNLHDGLETMQSTAERAEEPLEQQFVI